MTTYGWQLLRAGPLKLDAGSMFGVVPKAVWSRSVPADEQGRMDVAHNCLLLTHGGHHTLIETGSGDKFDEKNRKIFGLTNEWIGTALAKVRVDPESFRNVIVSHLHFDHAGGLVRVPGVPMFPNAAVHVQRREWDDARSNRSVMTRTYLPENLGPIEQQLQLHNNLPPFVDGYVPARDELPVTPLEERETEILPGIFVFLVLGHTWGQQAIRFVDETGQSVVFTPDILPTVHHVGAAYNMAYDVEPYLSTVNRRWFLKEAADRNWLLVLDHEPGNPCVRVEPDDRGWFKLVSVQ